MVWSIELHSEIQDIFGGIFQNYQTSYQTIVFPFVCGSLISDGSCSAIAVLEMLYTVVHMN